MKKILLLSTLYLFQTMHAKAEEITANKWSGWSAIQYVYPSRRMNFTLVNISRVNISGKKKRCNEGRQYYMATSDKNYEAKVKTLLSAFLAKREIKIFWDGVTDSDDCFGHVDRFIVR